MDYGRKWEGVKTGLPGSWGCSDRVRGDSLLAAPTVWLSLRYARHFKFMAKKSVKYSGELSAIDIDPSQDGMGPIRRRPPVD
jgi:hypothetical protein